jgi:hypothetical protein
MGNFAMEFNTIGQNNNAMGYGALLHNTTGSDNSGQGYFALANNTAGSLNIGLGYKAGANLTSGNWNIYVGNPGGTGVESGNIRIGDPAHHSRTYLAGVSGVTTGLAGAAVVVDANGQLGTVSSSRRYKQDIRPMQDASERLFQLRPVTFRYRQANARGERPLQYGLIAEEVAEVMPELAVPGKDGTPDTVAYHLLPALLLNELQKEHAELLEARARLESQARELAVLEIRTADVAAMKAELAELRDVTHRLVAGTHRGASTAARVAAVR